VISPASADGRDPRLDWLYRQIAALNEVDRSLALLMLDGFSYREMADIVGISETYVGVKLNRIKSALAGKVAEDKGHES
jgi:RNA polymerase sigma-70 factor, ECF subfamily